MPFVKSYGGAVRVLKQVGSGKASRNWIRLIDYSIKSPKKIKDMNYTKTQIASLKKIISSLKYSRKSPVKSRSPIKPARMSTKKWNSFLRRRESINKRKSKSRKTRSKRSRSRKKYRK